MQFTMEIKLSLLADYINVTADKKLNLMGLFTEINAPVFPHIHPQMYLALQMEAKPPEWDKDKKIEILLMDQDANKILSVVNNIHIPKGKSGKPVIVNAIMNINNLQFKDEGDYAFSILVQDDVKGSIPLRVNLAKQQKPGS